MLYQRELQKPASYVKGMVARSLTALGKNSDHAEYKLEYFMGMSYLRGLLRLHGDLGRVLLMVIHLSENPFTPDGTRDAYLRFIERYNH